MADIESEVTGTVWKLETTVGERIARNQVIMIIESMKMEIPVESPCDGTLTALTVAEQDTVTEGQVVARIEPD